MFFVVAKDSLLGNEQLVQLWKKPGTPVRICIFSSFFHNCISYSFSWDGPSNVNHSNSAKSFFIHWIWFQMNQCSYLYKLFSVFLVKVRSLTYKIAWCYKIHLQETCQALNLNHLPVTWLSSHRSIRQTRAILKQCHRYTNPNVAQGSWRSCSSRIG